MKPKVKAKVEAPAKKPKAEKPKVEAPPKTKEEIAQQTEGIVKKPPFCQ